MIMLKLKCSWYLISHFKWHWVTKICTNIIHDSHGKQKIHVWHHSRPYGKQEIHVWLHSRPYGKQEIHVWLHSRPYGKQEIHVWLHSRPYGKWKIHVWLHSRPFAVDSLILAQVYIDLAQKWYRYLHIWSFQLMILFNCCSNTKMTANQKKWPGHLGYSQSLAVL